MGEYVNSKQARFDKSFTSCGILEMHHLPSGNPHQTMFALATTLYHKANPRPAAFVLFSDIIKDPISRGEELKRFIENKEKNFGELYVSNKEVNPKTGNVIFVCLLKLNHENFRAWFTEETMNRLSSEN